jgi:hypothetical protein
MRKQVLIAGVMLAVSAVFNANAQIVAQRPASVAVLRPTTANAPRVQARSAIITVQPRFAISSARAEQMPIQYPLFAEEDDTPSIPSCIADDCADDQVYYPDDVDYLPAYTDYPSSETDAAYPPSYDAYGMH